MQIIQSTLDLFEKILYKFEPVSKFINGAIVITKEDKFWNIKIRENIAESLINDDINGIFVCIKNALEEFYNTKTGNIFGSEGFSSSSNRSIQEALDFVCDYNPLTPKFENNFENGNNDIFFKLDNLMENSESNNHNSQNEKTPEFYSEFFRSYDKTKTSDTTSISNDKVSLENLKTSDTQLSNSEKEFVLDSEEWNFFDDSEESYLDLESFRKKEEPTD